MRRIKKTGAYSKIRNIRLNVMEETLFQLSRAETFDFQKNKYLERIGNLRKNKTEFLKLLSYISAPDAGIYLQLCRIQGGELSKGIFSVPKIEVPSTIKNLAEFIFEKILFSNTYWSGLGEGDFSKMIFKKEFFESQQHYVCPYCDSMEDFELLNFDIDHLFPKDHFPLLYVHELNLFPCCKACNHSHYGKGNRWNQKFLNFFDHAVGRNIHFEFEPKFKMFGKIEEADRFLDLIQLKKRSSSTSLSRKIETQKRKVFNDLKKNVENSTFLQSDSPFYFLTRAIYKFYKERHFKP